MKTPEEINCGMECIRSNASRICIKPENGQCPRCEQLVSESLGRIQQLESRLAQVGRERDALWHDMHELQGALCAYCDNLFRDHSIGRMSCKVFGNEYGGEDGAPLMCGRFKWRGVCEGENI